MKLLKFEVYLFTLVLVTTVLAGVVVGQSNSSVKVQFQCDLPGNFEIFRVDGFQNDVLLKPDDSDKPLLSVTTAPGTVLRIKGDKNDWTATYLVDNDQPATPVSLKFFFSLQTPAPFRLTNDSKAAVDLLWIDANGVEKNVASLAPKESKSIDNAFPGDRWTLRSNGELVATYKIPIPDPSGNPPAATLSVLELEKLFQRQVIVQFDNESGSAIDIAEQVDGKDKIVAKRIPAGSSVSLVVQPATKIQINHSQGGDAIGSYVSTKDKWQRIPVKN